MLVRLVTLTVERDTPPHLLDALRRIAPNVELVHMGENRWWLGLVRPNPSQQTATMPLGDDALSQQPRWKRVQLQRQGFRFLGEYTDEQLSESYLCDELSFMMGRSEKELEADFDQLLKDADYASQMEQRIVRDLLEAVQADKRSIWAKGARGRVQLGFHSTPS